MASRSLKEEGSAIETSKPLVPKHAAGLILDGLRKEGKGVSGSVPRLCCRGYKRGSLKRTGPRA
jgi:hypothetical protein